MWSLYVSHGGVSEGSFFKLGIEGGRKEGAQGGAEVSKWEPSFCEQLQFSLLQGVPQTLKDHPCSILPGTPVDALSVFCPANYHGFVVEDGW